MIGITGIGIVSAYGIGKEAFISGAFRGSGMSELEFGQGMKRGGFVRDFSPRQFIPSMKLRKMSRYSQLALVSAIEARKESSLQGHYRTSDIGVIVATGVGSVSSTDSFYDGLLEKGPDEMNPMLFPETVQNIASAHISIEFGLHGPNTTFTQAGAAGEHALFYAFELLNDGLADAVLVTGSDELTVPLFQGMNTLRILSKNSSLRPFDRKRDGMLPGEGACTLILERVTDALKRGAHIYGVLDAFGFSTEPAERFHYTSAESMADAIKDAVRDYLPDLIIASANSTVELDSKEALAIKETLGNSIPVTSLSSMTGFIMSSGVMKIGAALLFRERGIIPPIWGLEEPEIEGLGYVLEAKEMKIRNILINGFSHGGSNACVIVKGRDEA
jgi:3-oxoacyl-[acyl-carrier-protein] synthase II